MRARGSHLRGASLRSRVHIRRSPGYLLGGLAVLASMTMIAPGADAGAVTTASKWVQVRAQTPAGRFSSYSFGSTSCLSASDCLSASTHVVTSTETEGVFVEHWNGKSWSTMKLPSFGQAAASGTTCLSASDCWFVGARFQKGYPTHAVVLHWNGKKWAVSPSPSVKTASGLNGIACYPSGCVSVGVECVKGTACFSLNGAYWTAAVRPLVENWNGKSWSISRSVQPAGSYAASLNEVRCTSAKQCVTIGFTAASAKAPSIAYSEVWNGKAWKVEGVPMPPETNHDPNSTALNDLACPSASDCVAVGGVTPQTGGLSVPTPLIETWDGSRWTIAALHLKLSGPLSLLDVSCLSATRCAVVGFADGYIEPSFAAAGTWNGSSLILGSGADKLGKLTDTQLFTVGCAGATTCVALGEGHAGSKLAVIGEASSLPR